MGKQIIDLKIATWGRKSKAGEEKNQERLNFTHPCIGMYSTVQLIRECHIIFSRSDLRSGRVDGRFCILAPA